MKTGHGGARKGAGKKKGTKWPSTLQKEAARAKSSAYIIERLQAIWDAQITSALGIRHTFMRDKSGRFVQLTDPQQIAEALNSGEEGKYYWTFSKDPSAQAAQLLTAYALDKPKEQEQEIKLTGEAELLQKLMAGRLRAAKKP